jgi:hypothetical protein
MFSRVRDAIRFCLEQTLVQAPGQESFYILVPLAGPSRKYREDHCGYGDGTFGSLVLPAL